LIADTKVPVAGCQVPLAGSPDLVAGSQDLSAGLSLFAGGSRHWAWGIGGEKPLVRGSGTGFFDWNRRLGNPANLRENGVKTGLF